MNQTATLEPVAAPAPLKQEEPLYEIVNGQRMELPPMSFYASRIASRLQTRLDSYGEINRQGIAVTETMFILDAERDLQRRPDVAFISAATWALDRAFPETGDLVLVPDLAVEVVGPTDSFEAVLAKMREYFRYGVKQVWLVLPIAQEIYVYDSPKQWRVLTAAEELDGGPLLPGFRLPVASLFQPQTLAAPTTST